MEHDYFGKDLPIKLLEVKALRIDQSHRDGEAGLMRTCWFDYRDMHPVAKTYLYAELYRRQTVKFYEERIDIRTTERARAFSPDDIFFSRDMTSMWLARQQADQLCMPYEFVLRFAQDRFFSRAQHNFPRPNQLYGEELEIDIRSAWDEKVKRQITYAASSRFRMANWRGELAQAQHIAFVVKQIQRRPAPRTALLARMLNEDVLSAPMIATHFGQADARAAESYCAQFL